MYAIYVNDIFNVKNSVKCILCVDDMVITVFAKSKDELLMLVHQYLRCFLNGSLSIHYA